MQKANYQAARIVPLLSKARNTDVVDSFTVQIFSPSAAVQRKQSDCTLIRHAYPYNGAPHLHAAQ